MILNVKRTIENSIVKTVITFESLASNDMSEEQVKQCLTNYNIVLDYSDMLFTAIVNIDENHVPYIVEVAEGEQPEGDRISFAVEGNVIVDENLDIEFAVDAETLCNKMGLYRYLQDTKDVACAMILIFETVVSNTIKEKFEENKVHFNGFEKEYTIQI